MARLTRDSIVTAAIEVIGKHGSELFSVRKLGQAIDADPTAIYRHFRSKDELLRAVGDRCLIGVTDDLPASSWRDCIRELCLRIRAANLAQPALATLVRGAPPRHDNERQITETILARLGEAGFGVADAALAYHALIELTIGSAAIDSSLALETSTARARIYAEWRTDYASLDPGAFPCSVQSAGSLYPGTADDRFAYALDRLLDGLATTVMATQRYSDGVVGLAGVDVRAASSADEASVVSCVHAAYEQYVAVIGRRPAPMLADYTQLLNDGLVRVAVLGDEIVGVIVMWSEHDYLYVDNVAVHPKAQGRGVGTALLEIADAAARDGHHTEVRLYTNEAMTPNLDYYPRRGFVETHRSDESGYRRVYYSKKLK